MKITSRSGIEKSISRSYRNFEMYASLFYASLFNMRRTLAPTVALTKRNEIRVLQISTIS